MDDNEIPRIFSEYLDKGEGLVKEEKEKFEDESYETEVEEYIKQLNHIISKLKVEHPIEYDLLIKEQTELIESIADFGKGLVTAYLTSWGFSKARKFVSGEGIGKKRVKYIINSWQLDVEDWMDVLKNSSAKEKIQIAAKCKDDQMLYHMAFNWQPFSNDIKLIRRELIKNPNFFPQLKIKLLQHIAPFDVHTKKRMYKHPEEYDAQLEKKLRKMIF